MYLFWFRQYGNEDRNLRRWNLSKVFDRGSAETVYNKLLLEGFDVALYEGDVLLKKEIQDIPPQRGWRKRKA